MKRSFIDEITTNFVSEPEIVPLLQEGQYR